MTTSARLSEGRTTPRVVETRSGLIEGVPGRTAEVTVFRGIPYAAPPVGDLRWRAPRAPDSWSGVRRADTFGPLSPQRRTSATEALGLPMSEDCLSLNVWTGADGPGERRPVLVWIYGGGFQEGSAADPRFDGENLARRGVVVVTVNYRLGALGFLATPELSAESGHAASGNYGVLDCIRALEWVQENIAAFGGDPDRVTIAGQSAGAGTVNFLTLSPLAAGLFQRAVAQSHARTSGDTELRYLSTSYRTLPSAEAAGARFAGTHGGGSPDSPASLGQLRATPWEELIDLHPVGDSDVVTGSDARPPLFRPVVDGWVLPASYSDSYRLGTQSDVDYLAGNNLDESGAMPESAFAALRDQAPAPWRPGRPPTAVTRGELEALARSKFGPMADEFLLLYPASDDDEAARSSNAAIRDNARVSTFLWAAQYTEHARSDVFTYFWAHRPPGQSGGDRRASHGSEIDFVFDNLDIHDVPWSSEDREKARIVSGYWVNFIATGDPNGDGLPAWPRYNSGAARVLTIGARVEPREIASPERIDFWRRFFANQPAW